LLVLGAYGAGDVLEHAQRDAVGLAHVAEDVLDGACSAGARPPLPELSDELRSNNGIEMRLMLRCSRHGTPQG
jgi:hypothetical protein